MFSFLLALLGGAVWLQGNRVTAFQITGATGGLSDQPGSLPQRLEINQFSASGPSFDLFILALQSLQSVDQSDQLSYFQIAGIHGYPEIPWDGVAGTGVRSGYCMHGSVLFPVWHRPYLAAFEQVLSTRAQVIAESYPSNRRVLYQNAALTMRIPFWDWALNPSLPAVATTPTISVNTPTGMQEIKNPLYRYDFHPGPDGNGFGTGHPFSNALFTTRWSDASLKQSNDSAATAVMQSNAANILSTTYQLLSSVVDYTEFSSTSSTGQSNAANSIENIHNSIHNYVGGSFGSMTFPDVAAFDPIFWLHHAQVDRIVAMWQVLNPSTYVVPAINTQGSYYERPGTVDSDNSSLAPFHMDSTTAMHTPETVRNIAILGYTYPEITGLGDNQAAQQATLRSRINALYNPSNPGHARRQAVQFKRGISIADAFGCVTLETAQQLQVNNLDQQWSVRVALDHYACNNTVLIDFFIGSPPSATAEWPTARNLIGTYGQFFAADSGLRHRSGEVEQIQGEVFLTHTLAAGVSRGFLADLSPDEVVPLLKDHLRWRARTQDNHEIDLGKLPGLSISVQSRSVTPSQEACEFPEYGPYKTYAKATEGKAGGAPGGWRRRFRGSRRPKF